MIVKHPRMIIKQLEYFINYRYVGDVSDTYKNNAELNFFISIGFILH